MEEPVDEALAGLPTIEQLFAEGPSPELVQRAKEAIERRAPAPPVSVEEWAKRLAADVADLCD